MFALDPNTSISKIADSLMDGEANFISNAANLTSLIFNYMPDLNWVGLYMMNADKLQLSVFQGLPACIVIPVGKGVCGTVAQNAEVLIVDDVHQFPGHIACDSASNSEIVIPIKYNNQLIGVLDLDSPNFNRFTENDKIELEKCINLLIKHSDCERIIEYYN